MVHRETNSAGGIDATSETPVASGTDAGSVASAGAVPESVLGQLLWPLEGSSVLLESRIALDPGVVDDVRTGLAQAAGRPVDMEVRVNPHLTSAAILHLGHDKKIDLDLNERLLSDMRVALSERDKELTSTIEATADYISEVIQRTEPVLKVEDGSRKGYVTEIGDGVAIVSGLADVGSQEVVRFRGGGYGMAFNLQETQVGCILLCEEASVSVGDDVERVGKSLEVPTGKGLLGRIVNALGHPIDGLGPVPLDMLRPVEKLAPGVAQRQPVSEPLQTGIKAIDALVPIGRGQRELILGDRKIGKTTIAIDTILNQKDTGVVCVYAAIGQKASSVARVVNILREHGALEYTVVVVALAHELPAFRYVAPYTACAIAEEVMERGGHSLVIYDDLSKHAVTYREMSALLKRPIGREAYPGDIFYVHSRLLERAARLRDDLGGGSMTALPIIETLAGDISAFVPTNVISICDGQIMLDIGLFNEGFRPPMDAGLSVSRVGGLAQSRAMKKVAGRLRIDLAQYAEMAQFVEFGAEVDDATMGQLARGKRERELLKQDQHVPLPLEKQAAILFAVVSGHADHLAVTQMGGFEKAYLEFLDSSHPTILAAIRETKDLTEDTRQALTDATIQFAEDFAAGATDAQMTEA